MGEENKCEELKLPGKFYGKPVYEIPFVAKALEYLNSAEDWKPLQFKGKIEVDQALSCALRIKLPNGIQFYLGKIRAYSGFAQIAIRQFFAFFDH